MTSFILTGISVGKTCVNETKDFSGARDDSIWDRHTTFFALGDSDGVQYLFVGDNIFAFQTIGIKFWIIFLIGEIFALFLLSQMERKMYKFRMNENIGGIIN